MVEALLKESADPNIKNDSGRNPLNEAEMLEKH
jgi:ankyrin repeat protein